jgi:hypothetical protein
VTARIHSTIGMSTSADVMTVADKGHQGAQGSARAAASRPNCRADSQSGRTRESRPAADEP